MRLPCMRNNNEDIMENFNELDKKIENNIENGSSVVKAKDTAIMMEKLHGVWPMLNGKLLKNYAMFMLMVHMLSVDKKVVLVGGYPLDAERIKKYCDYFKRKFSVIFKDKIDEFVGKSMAVASVVYSNLEAIKNGEQETNTDKE